MRLVDVLATLRRRVAAHAARGDRTRELEDELAHHAELLERDYRAAGVPAPEARAAALRRLGNRTRITEASWEAMGLGALDTLSRELRYALRAIRRSKGFAITVILTLALGIGGTATIFSVVDHVLLRPLGYPHEDRLMYLLQRGKAGNQRLVSYPTLEDWARTTPGFDGMSFIRGDRVRLRMPSGPEPLLAAFVSPGFFPLIGTPPEIGRTFVAEEELPSGAGAVVLSHDLWARLFGSDPRIIGKTVSFDSGSAVVIGVMPRAFAIPSFADLWEPIGQVIDREPVLERRDFHADSRAIGRLAPGVDLARATRLLSTTQQRISEAYPDAEADWTEAELMPFRASVVGSAGSELWALGGAVALMLLIASVNLANLAAVRGAARGREIAMRLSLGANRIQVARQILLEMLALCAAGGLAGLIGAYWAVRWLRSTAPFDLPRASELALDWRALAVAMCLTLLIAALFGVVPAMRAGMPRGGHMELLGTRSASGGSVRETRGRAILMGAQFALALLLLIGSGLLVQSYRRLQGVRLGFDPRDLLSNAISPPLVKYADARSASALYDRLVERLRAVQGVEDAAVVNFMPLGSAGVPTKVLLPGRDAGSEDLATYVTASEGYLRTMRIPLLRGRWFSSEEMGSPGDGVVISESVAKKYWPGADPLGKPMTIFRSSQDRPDFGHAVPSVVIGVVGDVRQFGPEEDPDPAVYVPLSAEPWPWASLVVRTKASTVVPSAALRRAILDVEPTLVDMSPGAGEDFNPVLRTLSQDLAPRRYVLGLVGAFSLCALLLAAVGIFGVTSYSVARARNELGVRLALGASRRNILGTVLLLGMVPAAFGSAIGVGCSLALARMIEHFLYDTSAKDPAVFIVVPVVLLAVGLLACYLPARRAAAIDPMIAIRSD